MSSDEVPTDDNFIPITDVVTDDDFMLSENDNHLSSTDDDMLTTDDDDDDRNTEHVFDFELLKVSAEDFKNLPSEEQRVHWLAAHLLLKKYDYNSTQKELNERSKVEQVSKEKEEEEEESKEKEEEESKEEEELKEEESKVPKTDDDGGCGPRGVSWKRSSKPHV